MKLIESAHDSGDKKKFAKRLMKEKQYDVVHFHMKAGEEITEHHAREETLIIVRTGKVKFDVEGETVELTNEEILHMEPYEKHSLEAMEETDFLLLKIR